MSEIVVTRTDERVTVVRAERRLTMVSAPQLTAVVEQLVAAGDPRIVVDLSGTEFIDSSGLGALVSCLKAARHAAGDLKICGAGEQVQMVLDLTNVSRVLRSSATVAEAVEAFG